MLNVIGNVLYKSSRFIRRSLRWFERKLPWGDNAKWSKIIVVPCDSWNIDYTVAYVLVECLKHMRNNTYGYFGDSPEEWDKILGEIQEGFEIYVEHKDDIEFVDFIPGNKDKVQKFENALALLQKHFTQLWW